MVDNNLRAELETLYKLEQLDSQRDGMVRRRGELPLRLKRLHAELEQARAALQRLDTDAAELERLRRHLELEVKHTEERGQKSQKRLMSVHTSEEYLAVEKEIETAKETKLKREEEILILMEKSDALKKERGGFETQFKEKETALTQQEEQLEAQLAEAETVLQASEGARQEILNAIKSPLLKRLYETIRKRYAPAVAKIEREFCTGCLMSFPPQVFNLVQRMENYQQCPNCSRILYWVRPE